MGEQTRHIFKDAVTQQNVYLLAYFCITAQSSCFMVGTLECFIELRAVKREIRLQTDSGHHFCSLEIPLNEPC